MAKAKSTQIEDHLRNRFASDGARGVVEATPYVMSIGCNLI